jgi:DNA topoisomerase IA
MGREQADWLVGMNLTRAYTVNARKYGNVASATALSKGHPFMLSERLISKLEETVF